MAYPRVIMSVVYVHIGLPKTGTTHVQDRLWRNRDLALDTSGLLYPGNTIADHFHAAVHLQPDRYLDWVDPAFDDAWPTMVAQMRAWPQRSLVSHELFSSATSDQIGALLADLSFADEVHVIATVRDLGRQLPSVWQENVKNQRQASFNDFVANIRAYAPRIGAGANASTPPAGDPAHDRDSLGPEEPFWEFQDYVGTLAKWADHVGPERVHIVTVPSHAAKGDTLWDRFLDAIDVDPAPLTGLVPSTNLSLSASQAEFLRRLNGRLQPDDIAWERYERVVKGHLIGEILFGSRSGTPQGLSDDQRAWAAERADAMIGEVRSARYRVTGSLDDLRVAPVAGTNSEPPPDHEVLDVALDTLAEMVKAAPMPNVRPRLRTRAKNVIRRLRRRLLAARTRLAGPADRPA
ncbi:hypothetical protein GCM10009624_14630 [Gordonia sinesedis]